MSRAKVFMAAIVGVLAFSALTSSMASAVTAGWMVNGTMLSGTTALANTAAVDEEGELSSAGYTIKCSKEVPLKGVNPKLNAATNMGDADSLEFGGCKGNAVCPLATSMKEKISTLPVLVDLTLDGTLAVKGRFLSTNSSKLFATFELEGAECSAAGQHAISGFETFLAPTGQDERTLQLLTTTNEESGLKDANNNATLKGSILIRLLGGSPFSFL